MILSEINQFASGNLRLLPHKPGEIWAAGESCAAAASGNGGELEDKAGEIGVFRKIAHMGAYIARIY